VNPEPPGAGTEHFQRLLQAAEFGFGRVGGFVHAVAKMAFNGRAGSVKFAKGV
jgi:hypothetical protein